MDVAFKLAGELIRRFRAGEEDSLTDKELDLIINTQSQVVEFLRSRGPEWALAYRPLVIELETEWKSFQQARARNKKQVVVAER